MLACLDDERYLGISAVTSIHLRRTKGAIHEAMCEGT